MRILPKSGGGQGFIDFDSLNPNKHLAIVCVPWNHTKPIEEKLNERGIEYLGWENVDGQRYMPHFETNIIYQDIDKIGFAYSLMADEDSRAVFLGVLKYRLTHDEREVVLSAYPQYFHPIVRAESNDVVIEAGGYDGATALQIFNSIPNKNIGKVYSFEPNEDNFAKLTQNVSNHSNYIKGVQRGLWNKTGNLYFHKAESSSTVTDNGEVSIPVTSIDDFIKTTPDSRLDMIKLDVEGSESEVIEGAERSIGYFKPKLQISVYHKATDLWDLVLQVHKLNPYYRFYMGHHSCSIIETIMYAVCD